MFNFLNISSKINIRIAVLFVVVVILLFFPIFVKSSYYLHLLITIGINSILAMAFIFVFRTGLVNMSIAAFWAIGAYSSAVMTMHLGIPVWISMPMSALVAAIVALIIGAALIKTAGFGFVILTSIIGMLMPTIIGNVRFIGGYQGLLHIPPPNTIAIPYLLTIEFSSKIPYYYLALLLVFISLLVFMAFYLASTGKAFMAIGLNPQLAGTLGISVYRYRLMAFTVASSLCGLAGSFYAHYQHTLMPTTFTMFKTLNIHICAIIGGMDFPFLGPIIGSILMTSIPELLRVLKEVQLIFSGTVVILLILFLPDGVLSLLGIRQNSGIFSKKLNRVGRFLNKALSGVGKHENHHA